uniref:Transposase, MuDR, MULE transposase domain protein n=1 Tax=Tanacetum cinerariifolium TaxID=118510 RepID=A0A6L2KTJ1_TANCI|nr:transposase, MuDR, MULE transposase domain protein [Tanacetum cinerariifolium]
MVYSVPHTFDQIKSMVEKQIKEDRDRQMAITNLAHEFDNACTAKDELRKAYEECRDIPLEQRALIENFLKIESDKDYKMHNALFRKAEKLEKQIIDKNHWRTNLVVVGIDGNNQIVPIAFGICKGETGPCWSWWMSVLKECIGDNPNSLFISDRHPDIALTKIKGLFRRLCKAYTPEEFASNMSILQAIQPDPYHKLCEVGPHRWSRAHCPQLHYNYVTLNSVESVNAVTILKRKKLVLMLAETYRSMVQEWYYKC